MDLHYTKFHTIKKCIKDGQDCPKAMAEQLRY